MNSEPSRAGELVARRRQRLAELKQRNNRTMRIEVRQGEQTSVSLYKMRYDIDRNLQMTLLTGQAEVAPEVKDLIQKAMSYVQSNPSTFQAFMNRAAVWETGGGNAGTVRVEGTNLLQSNDSVESEWSMVGLGKWRWSHLLGTTLVY
ncbi:hypothetical protein MYX82_03630 [Acidobacteria bacterium AH-259-D05]|nr:hypothetical protein [Acidobacteria bacterium AH-259-D05]